MKQEEFKPNINIISSLPRSLSTILYRSLLQNTNCICLFECFLHYNIKDFGYETLKNKYKDENDLYKIVETAIESATKSRKDVLIKDFGCEMIFHSEFIDKLVKNHYVKFLYLIRHPKPLLNSMFKALDADKDNNNAEDNKLFDYYKSSWEFYSKYKGDIFYTEDLLEFPEITMKKIFKSLGWEFSNKYLEFDNTDRRRYDR